MICLIAGCATTEKDIIKDLQTDPDNSDLIEKAAEIYYEKKEFNKAYTYYKKLESQESLSKSQEYRMYICGTRNKHTRKESWEKMFPIRNSGDIEYLGSSYGNYLKFTMPEHWILLEEEKKSVKRLPKKYKNQFSKKTSRGNISRTTRSKNFTISGGPEFVIQCKYNRGRSFFGFGYSEGSTSRNPMTGKTSTFGGTPPPPRPKLDELFRMMHLSGTSVETEDHEFYIYKGIEKRQGGRKVIHYIKTKYKIKSGLSLTEQCSGYAAWAERQSAHSDTCLGYVLSTEKSKNDDPARADKSRIIHAVFYKINIYENSGLTARAFFNEEYKEVYFEEMKDFIFSMWVK